METKSAKSSVNRRSWVSLVLLVMFIGMLVTGLLSFVLPYSNFLSSTHTWFGFGFLATMVWHLANNGGALLRYVRARGARRKLVVATVLGVGIVVGVLAELKPFTSVIELGFKLRQTKGVESGSYETIHTRIGAVGRDITIELRAGEHYESLPQPLLLGLTYRSTPQVAFWIEDMEGRYVETLYVTQKLATSNFRSTDLRDTALQRRPEALPYWAHKRGISDVDGLMVPLENHGDLDGVTAATPTGHYDIRTVTGTAEGPFRLLMEINRSYDFNGYYSEDRFPDDPVYSGPGSSGQPSVVYAATIEPGPAKQFYLLEPIGHGHHSGQDGTLYTDMSGIDTALELVERVLVSVAPGQG